MASRKRKTPKPEPMPPAHAEYMRELGAGYLAGVDPDDDGAFDCKGCQAWTAGAELDRGDGYCDRCVERMADRAPKLLKSTQRTPKGGAHLVLGFTRPKGEDTEGDDT